MAARDYTASCAICGGPGEPECPCEGERLKIAIEQAEKRWIEGWIAKTRDWVTNHSIQHIIQAFAQLKEARRRNHVAALHSIPHFNVYAQYRGRPPLHPHILAQLQRQIAEADADLKRGIDADWKTCVLRYPEVLAHYYDLVSVGLPPEASPPQLRGITPGPPPTAPPPQALGFGAVPGLGVLPDPPPMRGGGGMGAGGMPQTPMPPLSRTTSQSKRSSVSGKRMSMSRAERDKEMDCELERDLFKELSLKGTERTGKKVPTPGPAPGLRPEQMQRQASARPGAKRRDSGSYNMLSGRNPSGAGGVPPPPPGVPMPPGFGAYTGWGL